MRELIKQFVEWTKLKVKIHINDQPGPSFKAREIWWVNIGMNIGSEQNGKNVNFERPVLVLRKFNRYTFLALPTTSVKKNTPYHVEIEYKKYYIDECGKPQGTSKQGVILLHQLRTISSKRLIRKSGIVSKEDFDHVRERVKELI